MEGRRGGLVLVLLGEGLVLLTGQMLTATARLATSAERREIPPSGDLIRHCWEGTIALYSPGCPPRRADTCHYCLPYPDCYMRYLRPSQPSRDFGQRHPLDSMRASIEGWKLPWKPHLAYRHTSL